MKTTTLGYAELTLKIRLPLPVMFTCIAEKVVELTVIVVWLSEDGVTGVTDTVALFDPYTRK